LQLLPGEKRGRKLTSRAAHDRPAQLRQAAEKEPNSGDRAAYGKKEKKNDTERSTSSAGSIDLGPGEKSRKADGTRRKKVKGRENDRSVQAIQAEERGNDDPRRSDRSRWTKRQMILPSDNAYASARQDSFA
jgi:hypothetical protein